jgi:hypothetical protein
MEDGKELTVPASDESVALVASEFADPRVTQRGAAHHAFSLIFSLPFEQASEGLVVVPLPPPPPPKPISLRNVALWSSGVATAAGIVAVVLLLQDGSHMADEGRRASQLEAAQLNERIHTRNLEAMAAFSFAGAALTAGVLTWFFTGHEPKPAVKSTSPKIEVGLGQVRLSGQF